MDLLPFQQRFIRDSLRPDIHTSALSLPRGNGKSTLVAWLAARSITPNDTLFRDGEESFIFAASLGQARRTTFKQLKGFLDPDHYRIADSGNNQCFVRHRATGTKITCLAANSKTAQGIVGAPFIYCDEPGAWQTIGGEALFDTISTALGKPNSDMKVYYVGTLAPATEGWWHDLIQTGSTGSRYVLSLQGNPKKWSDLREVYKCNPLMAKYPNSRKILREERDAALKDSRLKSRFLSYRLNLPTVEESTMLLQVSDWQRVCQRRVPPRESRPVVGLDCGAGRAWSSAVAVYPNGRTEARALCPGVPSVPEQEKRDRVGSGTYQRFIDAGVLRIAHGRRVPLVSDLVELTAEWNPEVFVADRFRLNEVRDAVRNKPIITRRMLWSEASEDIRGTRRLCLDGNISIEETSKPLLEYSLSVAHIQSDDAGNVRLVKKKKDNSTRDDIAAAFILSLGVLSRARKPRPIKYAVAR